MMVKDVSATDGIQEAQAGPDGTDGDAGPINTHRRADCCLARSPQWGWAHRWVEERGETGLTDD